MLRQTLLKFFLCVTLLPAIYIISQPLKSQSFLAGDFDRDIPTVEEVLGYLPGSRITSPSETITYIRALADAAPNRVRLVQYATSAEGRPLHYLVLSAVENMTRIDAIKEDLQNIANGLVSNGSALPVTWLAYGVHGNEVTSTDAALMLAYHLLASSDDTLVDEIMKQSIVIIDPIQNPDGRARFVNSFRAARGIIPYADRNAVEHNEPWPTGRFNHHLFDLNRDWFTLSQPETRGKVAAIREWNPVAVKDIHEMDGDESYFFSPAADPINPNITPGQIELYEIIGKNNAEWFDRSGERYFTREVYDLFYPGYADTWNAHHGAIGSTYEQGSPRGLLWERKDGTTLTYRDGVRNHFIASLSTAEVVARNANRFLHQYSQFRRESSLSSTNRQFYLIDLGQRRWNAETLGRRLVSQGISVLRFPEASELCGNTYPAGYLAVPLAQPAGRLAKSLLDKDTPLPSDFMDQQERRRDQGLPHELYDVSAWSVGMMSGVDVTLCEGNISGYPLFEGSPITPLFEGSGDFALAVPWTDSGQARLTILAHREGITGWSTKDSFEVGSLSFPRGTVVFDTASNDAFKMQRLRDLAKEIGAHTIALSSSRVHSGPNFGSSAFARLTLPNVAMVWGEGVSPTSAGSLRFVLEQRLGLPVMPIRANMIQRVDLSAYDVLIIPDGNPLASIGENGAVAIKEFVTAGGVAVAIGAGLDSLTFGEKPLINVRKELALGSTQIQDPSEAPFATALEIENEDQYFSAIRNENAMPDRMPGALLNTVADGDHFLSSGYDSGAIVNASGSVIYSPISKEDGVNVLRFSKESELVASGHIWDENRRQIAFKPYMLAQRNGAGLAIGFVYDPSTRAYLDGLDLLLANAIFIAPSRLR